MTIDPPEELALKIRKRELLQRRNALIKQDGLAAYAPHTKQIAFHEAGAKYKRRMLRAGNRFGKSHMGCAEDCAWVTNERSWYPKGDPMRTAGIPQHPVKLLTITTDWDKVDEIWTGTLGEGGKVWKMLPEAQVKKTRRNHSGTIDTIELYNGSLWRFDTVKSYQANPQGSESSDWDAIHVDEPCPEGMFKAQARGLLDRQGAYWFTLTPLKEWWINDLFFPADTGGAARDDVFALQGSMDDNPHLTKEAIEEYMGLLNEEERECRRLGIPMNLSGLIYKAFKWETHVLQDLPKGWKGWRHPPTDWPVYVHFDVHPKTPHAVLFCAVSPHGQRFYFNDVFAKASIEELSRIYHEVVKGYNVQEVRVDPLAYIEDPVNNDCMAEAFWDNGVPVEKATKALAEGILKVNAELEKSGEIYFAPTCERLLWEIQRYHWDDKTDKPVDKDDHQMENLYRMELMRPKFIDFAKKLAPVQDIQIPGTVLVDDDMEYLRNDNDMALSSENLTLN